MLRAYFKDFPIRRKVVLITVLTALLSLILTAVSFILFEFSRSQPLSPDDTWHRLYTYGWLVAGITIPALLLAVCLASFLQGHITHPLLNLKQTTEEVTRHHDYSQL
jgi:cytochrome bd-type quinol oxidase subunit 2